MVDLKSDDDVSPHSESESGMSKKKSKNKGRTKGQKRAKKKKKKASAKREHALKKKKKYGLGNAVLTDAELRAIGAKVKNVQMQMIDAPPSSENEEDLLDDLPTEFMTGNKK